jgi:hypothetical protein
MKDEDLIKKMGQDEFNLRWVIKKINKNEISRN